MMIFNASFKQVVCICVISIMNIVIVILIVIVMQKYMNE